MDLKKSIDRRQQIGFVAGLALSLAVLAALTPGCTISDAVEPEEPSVSEASAVFEATPAPAMPVEETDEDIKAVASIPEEVSSCDEPGAYEASRVGDEIVITAVWAIACHAGYDLEIRLSYDEAGPTEARSRLITILNNKPLEPDTNLGVEVSEFDPNGVIAGRYSGRPFWVHVGRPTMVELRNGVAELAQGQVVLADGCFIQAVEASESTISATVRTFGDCLETTVEVTGITDSSAGLVATIEVS